MGSTGGCERMMLELRRRLRVSMAKAKNIATGTVTASSKQLTITGVGFRADHIAVLIQSGGFWYDVQTVFDGNAVYYKSGPKFATITIPVTFDEDGATMSTSDITLSPSFTGTYQWIAWQE